MKLTVKQAIDALAAVTVLQKQEMDYKTARTVTQWKQFLQQELTGVANYEDAIIERAGAEKKPDGTIRFQTADDRREYEKEVAKALETMIETQLRPLQLQALAQKMTMSGELWEYLEPVAQLEGQA